jgi:hypothetical protein
VVRLRRAKTSLPAVSLQIDSPCVACTGQGTFSSSRLRNKIYIIGVSVIIGCRLIRVWSIGAKGSNWVSA